MTTIIKSLTKWQSLRQQPLFLGKSIGFVPTMGNLHLGHESLLLKSKQENNFTVLSIFINPTQFDNSQDLANYPKTLDQDINLAERIGVDFVVLPDYDQIYLDNYQYKIYESNFSQQLCGKYRPGHFDGVLTIVLKLLNLIKPNKAYFGEKDYQQLILIKNMAKAFFLDLEIIACPIVRDPNGLALSSRNNLLSPEEYKLALSFPRLLNLPKSCEEIKMALEELGIIVDYIEEYKNRRLGAVKIGKVRLIDNIKIGECL